MTIENAGVQAVEKPWGDRDLAPWSDIRPGDAPIGEIWFQRRLPAATSPELLLKLIFTTQPLSIQVHPDDAFARSIGLKNGKTEAWYILEAAPGARVAAGLKRPTAAPLLRESIENGTIVDLVEWRGVSRGDVVFVPAGSIHAIGAGLVIAEIQQRGDTTFRLHDFGRERSLDIDRGLAVAIGEPAPPRIEARRLTSIRTLLLSCPQFVLESVDLGPRESVALRGTRETWVLVLDGDGRFGELDARIGGAVFVQSEIVDITAGARGLRALVAYPGPDPVRDLFTGPTRPRSERAPSRTIARPLSQAGKGQP